MCSNRDRFRQTGLMFKEDPDTIYYLLHASGCPHTCEFMKCHTRPDRPRVFALADRCRSAYYTEYLYLPFDCVLEYEMPITEDSELLVLEGFRFSHGVCYTNHPPVEFEKFVATHPMASNSSRGSSSTRTPTLPKDVVGELLVEHPWLTAEDLGKKPATATGKKFKKSAHGPSESEDDTDSGADGSDGSAGDGGDVKIHEPDIDGDDPDDEEGESTKPAWEHDVSAGDTATDETYFHLRRFGGAWTYGTGCFPRKGLATGWVLTYDFLSQRSFSYSKYGVEAATMLSQELLRRANYFFYVWLLADSDDFVYEQHHLDGYEETDEWLAWCCGLDMSSAAFDAATLVRNMKPEKTRRIVMPIDAGLCGRHHCTRILSSAQLRNEDLGA